MRKLLRTIWSCGCILLACFGIYRIVRGYLPQGIVGLAGSILLLPPLFERIGPWNHRKAVAIVLGILSVVSVSPLPSALHYGGLQGLSQKPAPTLTITDETVSPAPTEVVLHTPTASPSPVPTYTATPSPVPVEPELLVTCLDVGQGDATLIQLTESNGSVRSMMIDGGDRGTSSFVVARLARLGVSSLDAIVCTHYDADHTYGLIGCYEKYAGRNTIVYCPDYSAETATYRKFSEHLASGKASVMHPVPGGVIPFGSCQVTVLGPSDLSDTVENNRSIVLLLSFEGKTFLFPGDAEKGEETAILAGGLLKDSVTVLHVSHHGSYTATGSEFLAKVRPEYCVISVGEGNDYEHPHDIVLRRIAECGCEKVLRTDCNGEVCFRVRNGQMTVSTEK